MPDRSYRILLYTLALLGLAADQATKYSVFAWLHDVSGHTYTLFQTDPASGKVIRTFGLPDPDVRDDKGNFQGFHLAASFQPGSADGGRLVPHVNHGALFGILREYESYSNGVFAGISLLAAVGIVAWSSQKATARDRWLCVALGLILGGTLGNLYDRLTFTGVRDFLHWNYLYNWPVFNVADCCLVVGAGILLVQAFVAPAPKADGEKQAATPVVAGANAGQPVA